MNSQNWLDAKELNTDTTLLNLNDENSTIESLRNYTLDTTVYNLTVGNVHSYYVGIDGVLGHNSACKLPGPSLWKHIFDGEYKRRKVTGIHHSLFGMAPSGFKVVPFISRKFHRKGFYKAKIYKITQSGGVRPRNGKHSTMFPNSWSQTQVKKTIRKAYLKYIQTNKTNPVPLSSIMGSDYRGISIRFQFDGKNITSAYPEFNF